ncbi:hypothetical protein [Streptomyces palmae]|uniref:FtsK domain-containing protein n=1 Tax=Streptomyces palmae TaxID=1701085 RepID=A0A4Z0HDC7_9ACTN|nr:hypothetical protein [Streptomyces palmae]TGB18469.1 hypothetical protein E4099_01830 [Streptomyces palmae]
MFRRPLPRPWADAAVDVLHPVLTISRGLRRLSAGARQYWTRLPGDRRGPVLLFVLACAMVLAVLPYGPLLAAGAAMAAAGWAGRGSRQAAPGPDPAEAGRLQQLYEALVPYFSVPQDAGPLYRHGGAWSDAFEEHRFDGGRLSLLRLRYPAYFTDGEPECRTRVEQVLCGKSGRDREYLFDWDEEGNRLTVTALPPLRTDIPVQRFGTAPGETVLGFTDPSPAAPTLPVAGAEPAGTRELPPVVWRTGPRATEPHLLVTGRAGSGATTLLRCVALQALRDGDVLVLDGGGVGEYAFLAGRPGVLAVESGLRGVQAALEWAAHETEQRLAAADRARQLGTIPAGEAHRPLWILVDRPSMLAQLAAADGRPDPQELLRVPLWHGRAVGVTVVVAEYCENLDALGSPVHAHARARVVLGAVPAGQVAAVLGAPPHTTGAYEVPPGRGYARLGTGPVHRIQVPAAPDPYDPGVGEALRRAVLEMLPEPAEESAALPPADHGDRPPGSAEVREPAEAGDMVPGPTAPAPSRDAAPSLVKGAGPRWADDDGALPVQAT